MKIMDLLLVVLGPLWIKEHFQNLKFYTVITSTLDVFRGELSFPQDKPVEQWPEPQLISVVRAGSIKMAVD